MLKLPIRKCYFIAKVGAILLLVVTILSLFEQWRGGKRTARAQFADPLEEEYERQILEDEARIVPGLGADGAPAYLTGEDKRLGDESEKKYAINTHLSDRISYNRTLSDFRNPACSRVVYDSELPSASVVIIFHNEPYSVVVRTIHSVLDTARRDRPWHARANFVERESGRTMTLGYPGQDPNSEFVYLKEIILVDDNSTLPALRGKLSHYIRTRLPSGMVRLLRLPDRQGLMRARSRGARTARGDVLVFLDAHCEAGADWLRPLLQRVRHKRDAVVTPIVDVIDQSSFKQEAAEFFQVGGFTFAGHFTWVDVPEREKKRRGSDIAPTWSPTMAGGLFAISRTYYWELGAYDEQMAGWGGENLEMSFRIWQCGGTLETIPCSRVGHVFRAFHPYGMPAESDTHGINTARMAEVWMDDYAELFYLHRPDLRKNPAIGDVTHRKILREKLHCKSFQWYLDNIYREKFVPVRDVIAYGRIKNPASGLCLDTMQREGEASPLGLYPCHGILSTTQYLSLSLTGQLRDEEQCAELQFIRRSADESSEGEAKRVLMVSCSGKQRGQQWRYLPTTQQLQHVASGLCIDAASSGAGADVLARACGAALTQRWAFDYSDDGGSGTGSLLSEEQEARLRKLKGQRRKSRSLLAAPPAPPAPPGPEGAPPEAPQRRRHGSRKRRKPRAKRKGRKKGHKNKFILLIERTLMNGSEEHLELDAHCAHRRLLPNDSFVRDLVTILNERNIRVINNGRMFERNRVTELGRLDPRTMRHRPRKILDKMELPPPPAAAPAPPVVEVAPLPAPVETSKKRARLPTRAASGMADIAGLVAGMTGMAGMAGMAGMPGTTGRPAEPTTRGRIIVEDFIEIRRPTTLAPADAQPRKRKHRARPPPEAEDSPLLLPAERRGGDSDSDGGYWAAGQGSPKRNSTRSHPVRKHANYDSDDLYARRSGQHRADALTAQRIRDRVANAQGLESHDTRHKSSDKKKSRESVERKDTQESTDETGKDSGESKVKKIERARDSVELAKRVERVRDSGETRAKERGNSVEIQGRLNEVEDRGNKKSTEYADVVKRDGENLEIMVDDQGGDTPVKLVMRSNLTFNLGDELFAWRRQPQLASILDEATSTRRSHDSASDSDASSASDSSE